MRFNGRCNNSHKPSTGFSGTLLFCQKPFPPKDKHMKSIDVRGEVLLTQPGITAAVVTLNREY